jgi:hypothetical protein
MQTFYKVMPLAGFISFVPIYFQLQTTYATKNGFCLLFHALVQKWGAIH